MELPSRFLSKLISWIETVNESKLAPLQTYHPSYSLHTFVWPQYIGIYHVGYVTLPSAFTNDLKVPEISV